MYFFLQYIPKHWIFFTVIINNILVLMLVSKCSLLAHRNAIYFKNLIFYLANLLISLISFKRFLVDCLGFPMYTTVTKPDFGCSVLISQKFEMQVSVEGKDALIRKANNLGKWWTNVQRPTLKMLLSHDSFLKGKWSRARISANLWGRSLILHHSPLSAEWQTLSLDFILPEWSEEVLMGLLGVEC